MQTITVKQRYSGATLKELTMHTASDVDLMLSIATDLHKNSSLSILKRIEILQKLASLIENDQEYFAKLIANEGGKPLKDANVEVTRAIDGIYIAIAEIRNIKGESIPMDLSKAGENHLAFTILEPIGVIVAISAFNHPLNLIIHQVIPAIAAGCPIIIKPASATPLNCLYFAKLMEKANLPTGWLQVALLNNKNAEKLVTSNKIAFFSFIGSAKVGWALKAKLAKGVRCALEHGGVAPVIFNNFSDVDSFVAGVVKAGYYHAGQVCVSAQKIFIPANEAEEIANKIAKIAKNLIVGDAILETTDIGPMISASEVNRVDLWVKEAIEEGATLITGGKKINDICFEPTILLNPSSHSKVSKMEIFAPVICIYSYENINEAIQSANSLDVAFQASIFSDDINTAINTAKSLNASAVMINDYTTFRVDWMPFAGRKHSGYGVGGIGYTMRDMLVHKLIIIKH